ncbi:AraC family transcriptional regulator [Paenibacillus sp. FSL H8-0034]|uniref:AraC family transcriptional regulator n=1 Tax=Paenibacillus sp. FSL H8-0034 TaxID=2954671 RepID=UPI0030FBF69D
MAAQRSFKHYSEAEVLPQEEFVTVMDVHEHHWLLEHSHDFPEMIVLLGGKGAQFINGVSVPVQEGDIYLIPLGTTHVFRPTGVDVETGSLSVRDVIIRATWLEHMQKAVPDDEVRDMIDWLLNKREAGSDRPAWIRIEDTQGRLRSQTEALKELLQAKSPVYRTKLAAGMLELLATLSVATRQGREQQAVWPQADDLNLVKGRIDAALLAIPLGEITLADVATKLHMSARHLSRIFPFHYGMSFKRYVQELRFKESRKLLLESKLTVKEIMQQVGSKDADHYYSEFKRRTGLTPGQFRR